jgi:hypothetical protein
LFQTLIPQLHFGDFFNAIGQQRRFGDVRDMSALALNSGHKSASQQVTRSANRDSYSRSLDHLVSAKEDRSWHRNADRSRGLEIDDELEFGDLLDRQVGGLGAAQDFGGERGNPPHHRDEIHPE